MIRCALLLFAFLVSCTKAKEYKSHEYEVIKAEKNFDLVFPEVLWNKMKGDAPLSLNTKQSAYDLFQSLKTVVQVTAEHGNALSRNYQFEFIDFGGEIDWDSYLNKPLNGTFRLSFRFPEVHYEGVRVFFLSWTKNHKIKDEVFGNGCGTLYDVTGYFKKTAFQEGIPLHTKDFRYFDLTAGRFYFVSYEQNKIGISQVTFFDKNHEDTLCEEKL